MKRTLFLYILTLALALSVLSPLAMAAETGDMDWEESSEIDEVPAETAAESCGEGLRWSLDGGILSVYGSGEITSAPWEDRKDEIIALVLGGVTKVGDGAFAKCENLKSIDFGDALKETGDSAFQGCTSLTAIDLPDTFRLFGPKSFEGCTKLTIVNCAGPMPSFRGNCLWNGSYITIYYPVSNPWPEEPVAELMYNFGERLEVLAEGTESEHNEAIETPTVPPTASTEPPTEATTAPTTTPTTAPTTEPTTVPTTEATTAPATEPSTQAVTVAATEAVTEPIVIPTATEPQKPEKEPSALSGGIIGLVLIVAVITFFLIGALVYKASSRKKKY